ncbi:LysE family translocator [Robertkochia marina]|uniref:LysE family translocator n=1 Tax=Robertkochia marina TaxID=1227945 RepID=A0A4S3LXC1_9FLAO|nr:LysE family translocator [Robertkochia marina]THD65834.1 LysE family translocator [Robertkochia marina]TRZ41337.1 LysE family translocator [Robertkochia marina]
MNTEILYAFILSSGILAISPGPDNIYVLLQSLVHGVKYGLATVAGLMTGCIIHTSLVAFGVSAVIKQSPWLFMAIKIFGACYLFFLAWKVFQSDGNIDLNSARVKKKSPGGLFVQGFFMNVLNPKVSIFFLAFFPGFLFSKELDTVWQFYILGGLFIIVSAVIFSSIAVMAGKISGYLRGHRKSGLVLKWAQIIVFVLIGFFILLSEN